MIQQEKPAMVFLQETKCNSTVLEAILIIIWPGCRSVSVDASRASGGLSILWNPQVYYLEDFNASHYVIQATFHLIGTNIHGHLSNVYFPQELQNKMDLLETLSVLNSVRRYPLWLCGGDFNMISSLEERSGGRLRLEGDSIGFRYFIHRNQLIDFQTSNGIYTWTNKRRGPHHIASRLDHFLMSDNAIHLGGALHASIMPQMGSDHWPIMLQWTRPGSRCNRPFRFEAF